MIDDDPHMRRFVAMALEDEGYEVQEAADGEGALALLDARHVDLVLADVVMPGIDGVSLARLIRQQRRGLPVVLMSAAVATVDPRVAPFLPKPFDVARLVDLVRRALGPAAAVDEAAASSPSVAAG